MKAVLALVGGALVFGAGLAAGVAAGPGEPAPEQRAAGVVVLRAKDGTEHELTVSEAAARIERLEDLVGRVQRARAAAPDDPDDDAATSPPPPSDLPNVPIPTKADGKAYTFEELRTLARTSTDHALRLAAIRSLRRDDSDESRAVLRELTADAATPADLRVEAAKALSKPPHRDASPEQLVAMLAATDLPPDVRREVADGVAKLRDRGAWMSEISTQLGKETDAEVRKTLFDAVLRSPWDPAAREQLLGVIANEGASIEDRRAAVGALAKNRDGRTLDLLSRFLGHGDPGLRESAVLALANANRLSAADISQALGDPSGAVRAAAFSARLPNLGKGAGEEEKAARSAALDTAIRLATTDPDPDVRRSALQWTATMPKAERERVLDAARNDGNALVQLEAWSRSPAPVVKEQPGRFLSALESTDAKVRDAAYRLITRTWEIDVPYRAGWNPKARAAAVASIREQMASR